MRFIYTIFVVFILNVLQANGQDKNGLRAVSTDFQQSMYRDATILSQNLYNGRIYYMYDSREEEFQFFKDRKPFAGIISVENQTYQGIPLLYDLVTGEVVVKHFDGDFIIIPFMKVNSFQIHDHHFKKLKQGEDINENMPTGFYDLVYDGVTQLLIRRMKVRQEKIQDRKVVVEFHIKDQYFIKKNERYYQVHTKKSILNLLPEHKKELRRSIRDFEDGFRRNREEAMIKMVNIHDQLSKK
jgi:hypothetical protein